MARNRHGYAVLVNGVEASVEASQAKARAIGEARQRNACRVIVQDLSPPLRAWELVRNPDGTRRWRDLLFANTTV